METFKRSHGFTFRWNVHALMAWQSSGDPLYEAVAWAVDVLEDEEHISSNVVAELANKHLAESGNARRLTAQDAADFLALLIDPFSVHMHEEKAESRTNRRTQSKAVN